MRILWAFLLCCSLCFPAFARCDQGEVLIKFGLGNDIDFKARKRAVERLRAEIDKQFQRFKALSSNI